MSLDIYLEVSKKPYMGHAFNATHNLTPMWDKAGVYEALYMSGEHQAGDIIKVLKEGLGRMTIFPEQYRRLEPDNGWGTYEGAIIFLAGVLRACVDHPKAIIHVSK